MKKKNDNLKEVHYIDLKRLKKMSMRNDFKRIHNFDYSLIREYYLSVERQGSGSP